MPNCKSCTGPLKSNSHICSYCGTHNDIDWLKQNYTHSNSSIVRICPQCDIPLTSIKPEGLKTLVIEHCSKCMGLFFEPFELKTFLEHNAKQEESLPDYRKIQTINKEYFKNSNKFIYRKCPVCRQLMHRKSYGKMCGVILDECRDHGIWLDSGELKHIVEWKKAGGTNIETIASTPKTTPEIIKKRENYYRVTTVPESFNNPAFESFFEIIFDAAETIFKILYKLYRRQ